MRQKPSELTDATNVYIRILDRRMIQEVHHMGWQGKSHNNFISLVYPMLYSDSAHSQGRLQLWITTATGSPAHMYFQEPLSKEKTEDNSLQELPDEDESVSAMQTSKLMSDRPTEDFHFYNEDYTQIHSP